MISKSFARCLAKILGDGNLYYRYIRYSNNCKELREEFIDDIRKEFGGIKITEGTGNSGTPFLQIHGKKIIKEFLSHHPTFKSKDVYIPYAVKNADKEIKREFVRAYYDDEGSPSIRLNKKTMQWKRNISLYSNSIGVLIEIKETLNNEFVLKQTI